MGCKAIQDPPLPQYLIHRYPVISIESGCNDALWDLVKCFAPDYTTLVSIRIPKHWPLGHRVSVSVKSKWAKERTTLIQKIKGTAKTTLKELCGSFSPMKVLFAVNRSIVFPNCKKQQFSVSYITAVIRDCYQCITESVSGIVSILHQFRYESTDSTNIIIAQISPIINTTSAKHTGHDNEGSDFSKFSPAIP